MKATTKLMALGALGAAAFGATKLFRKQQATRDVDQRFDTSDVDFAVPVIITEEVVVIEDPFTE
jgi:hypothetical protein